jgi:hypothetical protein
VLGSGSDRRVRGRAASPVAPATTPRLHRYRRVIGTLAQASDVIAVSDSSSRCELWDEGRVTSYLGFTVVLPVPSPIQWPLRGAARNSVSERGLPEAPTYCFVISVMAIFPSAPVSNSSRFTQLLLLLIALSMAGASGREAGSG